MMMKDLKTRTITGVLIFIAVVGFIALRHVSTYFFDAFVLLMSYGATYEIVKVNYDKVPNKNAYMLLAFTFVYASYLPFFIADSNFNKLLYLALLVVLYFIVSMFIELLFLGKQRKQTQESSNDDLLKSTIALMRTICYPTLLLCAFYGINSFSNNVGLGTVALVLVFGVTMSTDVFAYLFGCMIRGPKLVPQISPKKSISGACFGLLGGICFAMLAMWLLYFENILNITFVGLNSTMIVIFFVLAGVLGSVITQFGDLFASAYKRKNDVKDFGNLFPGHGGVMDRVDGLMFTAVLIYLLMFITF